ncbi:MAG: apu 3 [Parcubacteria group bacterium]|nr:apu 3 [Parcubacteria group bacterium]
MLKFKFFFIFVAFIFLFPLTQANADIATGLVSHWKMDETSGTTATDSAGTNNGTITGATFTTGKLGNALSFNGTSDYASISKVLQALSEFTASAWVKVSDLTTNRGIFTSGGTNSKGFRFRINTNGAVSLLMAGGGVYDILTTSAGAVQTGSFYHIAVTGKSGQYMRIYVSGILVAEKTTTQAIDPLTATGYIGTSWGATSELMNGLIDDIRIYSRPLSASDITELYNYTGSGASSSSSSVSQSSSSSIKSAPTVTTNSAANITSTSATLNATVNNNGLTATAYFQYGLTTAYGNTSPTQTVSSLGNISINSAVSNLSPSTVYYYRIVAQSSSGTTYGSAPVGRIGMALRGETSRPITLNTPNRRVMII